MKTANLKVGSLTDRFLADEVRKTLEARRGVRTATVHPGDPAGVEVEYDERSTTPEQLVATLRDRGFIAEIGGFSAGGAP